MFEPAPTLSKLIEDNLADVVDRAVALISRELPPQPGGARPYFRSGVSTYVRLGLEALRTGDPSSFLAFRRETSRHIATIYKLPREEPLQVEACVRAAVWDSILPSVQSDQQQLLAFARDMKALDQILDAAIFTVAGTHLRVKEERLDSLRLSALQKQLDLSALSELETLVVSDSELQSTLDLVTQRMGELSRSEVVFLVLEDQTRQRISIVSVYSADPSIKEWLETLASTIGNLPGNFDAVFGPGGVSDLSRLAIASPQIRAHLEPSGLTRAIFIPLVLKDETVGIVALFAKQGRQYDEEEIHRYTLLANQAAIAINHARLYETARQKGEELATKSEDLARLAEEKDWLYGELQEKLRDLVALQKVSQAVVSSLDLHDVLQTITAQATQVLEVPKAAVVALNPETGMFECIATTGFSPDYAEGVKVSGFRVGGTSLAAAAISLGRPQWTNDALRDHRFPETIELARLGRYRSLLAVPIGRTNPLAALCVYAGEPNAFSESRIEVLSLFANHAAIAIQNAQLYAQQVQSEKRSAFLAEVSELFNSSLELPTVLQMVAEKVTEVLGDGCVIYELPDGSDLLEANILYRRDPAKAAILHRVLESTPPRLGVGVAGRVAQSGQPMLIVDARDGNVPDPGRPHIEELNLISTIGVPLKVKHRVLGAMVTSVTDSGRHFDEDDLALAAAIAERAASAIENARLYRRAEDEAMLRGSLYEVGKLMNSTLELDQVLAVIVRQAVRLTGAELGLIALWNQETNLLETKAIYGMQVPDEMISHIRFRIGEGPIGLAAQVGEPIVTEDLSSGERTASFNIGVDKVLRSNLAVPIKFRDQTLGVIDVANKRERGSFVAADGELLVELTSQAAIAIDNARLYQLEKKRVNSLQEVSQLKSDFVSSVSHELRTPLTTIKGSLQTLLRSWEKIDSDKRRHYVHMAHDASDRLLRLIEDILFVSRVEEVRPRTQVSSIDLGRVVARAVHDVSLQHGTKKLQASLPAQPLLVLAEESKLLRVLVNLLDNAAKYSAAKESVQVGLQIESDRVTISVADRGVGIAAQDQSRLFTRFGRVGRAAKTQPGTGLGLFISKQLVEEMGGRIWLDSQPGQGSTFYFTLPTPSEGTVQPNL